VLNPHWAGIQRWKDSIRPIFRPWTPACAGVTYDRRRSLSVIDRRTVGRAPPADLVFGTRSDRTRTRSRTRSRRVCAGSRAEAGEAGRIRPYNTEIIVYEYEYRFALYV